MTAAAETRVEAKQKVISDKRKHRAQVKAATLKAQTQASERLASGKENDTDRLRRDLDHSQGEKKRLTSIVTKYERRASADERVISEIMTFIEGNPFRPQLGKRPRIKATTSDHEMVALVSDAHFPEVVDPAQTFGLLYNAEVCKARMTKLRDTILRYVDLRRKSYNISKLTIAVLGDMLSGDIHDELAQTNQFPIAESVTGMAHMLFEFGLTLAEEIADVEMVLVPGNHPRVQRKPAYKQKFNNWETVMGHFVAGLARDRFTVVVPKDLVYRHIVANRVLGFTHGDGVKAQSFAGIPWYSLDKRRNALQALLKHLGIPQLDLLCYGHFHQLIFEEGQGCSIIINGSIKGGDEFGIGTRYAAQSPVQALLTFHPRHGLTDLSRINLED